MQILDSSRASSALDTGDDGKGNWCFAGMMTVEEKTTFGICCKLREVQLVCRNTVEFLLTTAVEIFELAREGVKMKGKTVKLSDRNTDKKVKFMGTRLLKVRCVVKLSLRSVRKLH